MRILFYNWVDPLDPGARGGGISVYQRALLTGLATRQGIQTAFLSAGLAHDLRRGPPRIAQVQGGPQPHHLMVNAGSLAPAHADFAGTAHLDHPATEAAFADFVDRTGPWDAIHIQSLEGLPANILTLRTRWPNTRIVLSLHNYYPMCPQVNLWHQERIACTDFHQGADCLRCLPAQPDPRTIRLAYAMDTTLARWGLGPGTAFDTRVFRPMADLAWRGLRALLRRRGIRRSKHQAPPAAAAAFVARRARMVALINAHADAVLCVSDRVRQIARQHGVDDRHLHVLRIGTTAAEAWPESRPQSAFLRADGTLHLAFLGYMRRNKGFHFLMQALAAMPDSLVCRLRLTIAARRGDDEAMALMAPLRGRLADLHHVDGYRHEDLADLLSGVDLGIVPVLWEDNLPQVAIEMHSRRIPLLTADRGGARELGNCPALVFEAGNAADLQAALTRVLDGSVTPAQYWANAIPPVTVDDHIEALLAIYRGAV